MQLLHVHYFFHKHHYDSNNLKNQIILAASKANGLEKTRRDWKHLLGTPGPHHPYFLTRFLLKLKIDRRIKKKEYISKHQYHVGILNIRT